MADLAMTVSPGFLLLTAFLYYIGGGGALTAFFSAMLAHELGHILVLWALGGEIRSFSLSQCGPVIEYYGDISPRQEMCILAAGPLCGIGFAVFCFSTGTPYFHYAGAIALMATLFNLLPVEPMDGGRLMRLLLEEVMPCRKASVVMRLCGNLCAGGVMFTGLWTGATAALVMGIWMAVLANMPQLR